MKELARVEIHHPRHVGLVFKSFEYLFSPPDDPIRKLREALEEVVENVLLHAYDDPDHFWVEVSYSADDQSVRIDLSESGVPFDFGRYLSESIERNTDHTKGFYRIYDLVERFYFSNLPGKGKRFSLIASRSGEQTEFSLACPDKSPGPDAFAQTLIVRRFEAADAEGIARLIYRNYAHTYYKTLYYDPAAIVHANGSGEIVSIVALHENVIVGHFALILSASSPIAEIGAAVVDPKFKGNGIMNRMFDHLVDTAKAMRLNALYGEAIMLHPYSQKANLRHGMVESAILLGEVPASIEIEHRLKPTMRSGAMVAFLLFDTHQRNLRLPRRYEGIITALYDKAHLSYTLLPATVSPADRAIEYRYNRLLNIGTIIIDAPLGPGEFDAVLDILVLKRCDMIYADINLHRIDAIDDLVTLLSARRFFYAGVMFSFYRDEDYLRLQRKNALDIDEEQLVCYSEYARELLTFILEDECRSGFCLDPT